MISYHKYYKMRSGKRDMAIKKGGYDYQKKRYV